MKKKKNQQLPLDRFVRHGAADDRPDVSWKTGALRPPTTPENHRRPSGQSHIISLGTNSNNNNTSPYLKFKPYFPTYLKKSRRRRCTCVWEISDRNHYRSSRRSHSQLEWLSESSNARKSFFHVVGVVVAVNRGEGKSVFFFFFFF